MRKRAGSALFVVIFAAALVAVVLVAVLVRTQRQAAISAEESRRQDFSMLATRMKLIFDNIQFCTCNVKDFKLDRSNNPNGEISIKAGLPAVRSEFGYATLDAMGNCNYPFSAEDIFLKVDTNPPPSSYKNAVRAEQVLINRFLNLNEQHDEGGIKLNRYKATFSFVAQDRISDNGKVRSNQSNPVELDLFLEVKPPPDERIVRCYSQQSFDCNPAATTFANTTEATNAVKCTNGIVATQFAGTGPWTWKCGKKDCTALPSASCGSANNNSFPSLTDLQNAELCKPPILASPITGSGQFSWTCGVSTCVAYLQECGDANGKSFADLNALKSAQLCKNGVTPTDPVDPSPWKWACGSVTCQATANKSCPPGQSMAVYASHEKKQAASKGSDQQGIKFYAWFCVDPAGILSIQSGGTTYNYNDFVLQPDPITGIVGPAKGTDTPLYTQGKTTCTAACIP